MDVTNNDDQEAFFLAYVECALWSSTACGAPGMDENDDTSFYSYGYNIDDLSPQTAEDMREDCMDFMQHNAEDLKHWSASQAGHDFWLTRHRHGAGFWDRYWGDHPLVEVGDRLTEASHPYGDYYLYVGDAGLIYGA